MTTDSDLVELVERELGLRLPIVFVLQAWSGEEFVRVVDEETGSRYYGMSAELWQKVWSRRMLQCGRHFEDVQVHHVAPSTDEVRIPVYTPTRAYSLTENPPTTADLRREIVIRRPR